MATLNVKDLQVLPGRVQVPGNHHLPPRAKPKVNIQCLTALLLVGWDINETNRCLFRKSSNRPLYPNHKQHIVTFPAHPHNTTRTSGVHKADFSPLPSWHYTPLLFQTPRLRFSPSIVLDPNPIKVLTPLHFFLTHQIVTVLFPDIYHKWIQLQTGELLGFPRPQWQKATAFDTFSPARSLRPTVSRKTRKDTLGMVSILVSNQYDNSPVQSLKKIYYVGSRGMQKHTLLQKEIMLNKGRGV